MTTQLTPAPVFRAWDNLGLPLFGGQLFAYIAGTTTKQATYTDSTGGTPNTNPVILNARGEANVWLDPTKVYKLVLAPSTDTDPPTNPFWTVDNISGGNASPAFSIIPTVDNLFTLGSASFAWANVYVGPNHAPVLDTVSGNIGYYARTAAEISAGVTPTNLSYTAVDPCDIRRYGAQQSNTDAQNLTALNSALLVAKNSTGASSKGCFQIVIPADCHYGYKVTDLTTFPQFSGTVPIVVIDYSAGNSYAGYPTAYDGMQARYFYYTPQTTASVTFTASLLSGATSATLAANWTLLTGPWVVTFSNGDVRNVTFTNGATTATWTTGLSSGATASATFQNSGQHDGNQQLIRAAWAPDIFISNDANLAAPGSASRLALDNRRCGYAVGNDGHAYWEVGQGTQTGAGFSNEDLSNFVIQKFSAPGDTLGVYTPMLVQRSTGNISMGNATNTPQASFHVLSPSAGVYQGMFENPLATLSRLVLRESTGVTNDIALVNSAGKLSLNIPAQGDALEIDKTTRRVTIDQSFAEHLNTLTYAPPTITVDSTLGGILLLIVGSGAAFTMQNPTGGTAGTRFTITMKNASGGAVGAVTWNALYKMAAWTSPANGFQRSISFYFDGTNWIEFSRTTVDVPN